MRKITLSQKLRYHFDNSLSGGTASLIGWLALITLCIILIASSILVINNWQPASDAAPPPISNIISPTGDSLPIDDASLATDTNTGYSFPEAAWQALMRSLDAGTVGGDAATDDGNGWAFRVWGLVITLTGLFIVGSLISILSSGLESKLEALRKGHSLVCEENHTLILGWSSRLFLIISELAIANANVKKPRIVILADQDKIDMEDQIRSHVGNTGRTQVICRSGSPIDLAALDVVNPQTSKSIIILSPEGYADPDAQVIKMILAITNHPDRRVDKYHIVAELRHAKNSAIAKMIGKDEIELIIPNDLIAKITVQTSRQVGLSSVYKELLNFSGDEIYFKHEPVLAGKTYGDALASFEHSALIGLHSDGVTQLNPNMATTLQANDTLICIAADDDKIRVIGTPNVAVSAISNTEPRKIDKERDIILGWNQRAETIVREMDCYAAPDSELTIVSELNGTEAIVNTLIKQIKNLKINFILGDTTDRDFLDTLDLTCYAHIILLCYSDSLAVQEADAKTLLTLLHLRDIEVNKGESYSIVSEMMDSRNQALAEIAKADDFIVSDELVGLLLTQISENKQLSTVFNDLFDADGAEIYLKPVEDYVCLGQAVNFYTVVEAARRKNETAIGYRLFNQINNADTCYGININPVKSITIEFDVTDKIIVLAGQ
ncbi:CASTOR/POLLUX-related putative ion channel [Crenothrix polyspora]|uniref:Putative secreted protein n=1 Tax=Crenothrix polyspora TaxID=360316 RepID=A0A1R4GYR8_9GAMM|nr:NAD-binding protein [Crenothrix polyspora]SJM89108.1 putative secreted protein [Crenothrix polyspora]